MQEKETILFAPLNWGLGHATRVVPLITDYLKKDCEVIIAAEGVSLQFLKQEFSELKFIDFPGFRIKYAAKPFFLMFLLLQMPFFLISIWIEHLRLNKIIKQHNITTVISDNRYGLWSKKIKSVLITHQLFIQLPNAIKFLESGLHLFTRILTEKFSECWVPDYADYKTSLAGNLSHGLNLPNNVKYIEPLSRFKHINFLQKQETTKQFDVFVLISGPEPLRTKFEKEMIERFYHTKKNVLIVCGKLSAKVKQKKGNITLINHLETNELLFQLKNVKNVIARSGYSTIMDFHVIGINAELIPTPGQTEQEYLAEWNALKQNN